LLVGLALIGAGGLLYAGLFFLFGLAREEREWFTAAATHVWRRTQAAVAA
jgi:hypothetical protein